MRMEIPGLLVKHLPTPAMYVFSTYLGVSFVTLLKSDNDSATVRSRRNQVDPIISAPSASISVPPA
jgi:hypothetical protein